MDTRNRILVEAGGGLVTNEIGEVLFIFRRGKWDLPKGKLDPGESLKDCALREVKEETGLGHIEPIRFLLITKHEYIERGKSFIKETHWWLMKTRKNQRLNPQLEEDITEIKWVDSSDFKVVQQNTYSTILEVLKAAGYSL